MRIVLVASENRNYELKKWAERNLEILKKHELYSTKTSGKYLKEIEENVSWNAIGGNSEGETYGRYCEHPLEAITCLHHGLIGGLVEIGSMIVNDKIDVLIFFNDNIADGNIQNDYGLTNIASLYNIAFATNQTTADIIINSPLLKEDNCEKPVSKEIIDYIFNKNLI